MLTKITSRVIFFSALFLSLLFPVLSIIVYHEVKYDWLIAYILHEISRYDLYEIITKTYFPVEKFLLLKSVLYCISVITSAVFILLIRYRKKALHFIQYNIELLFASFTRFSNGLTQNSRPVNILLILSMLVILARSIYYTNAFYIQYDEAWNYNYFLHKNIFYSFFAYNNYPLHNIISWFFVKLLGTSAFVLRLPSVISGLFTCALIFTVIKKIFRNEWIALSAMLLFSCLPVSVFYMLYARGVMFEMFFSILICYLLSQSLKEKVPLHKIIFLSLLNALGTFSMLSHAYFIVLTSLAASVYLLFQKEKQIRFIILYPLLSISFSVILLAPMILGTGISPGVDAGVADANYLVLHYLPFHCYSDFMAGSWFVFYILAALNIVFILKPKEDLFLSVMSLIFILSPFIIRYTTGIFPPERALAFLTVSTVLTFAMTVRHFSIKYYSHLSFTLITLFVLNYSVYNHPKLNWSKQLDKEVYKLADILKRYRVKSVYSENSRFSYYVPGIQYYYYTDKKEIIYTTSIKGSTRYHKEGDINTDCVIKNNILPGKIPIYDFDSIYAYYLR